jgi:hypothetical protein
MPTNDSREHDRLPIGQWTLGSDDELTLELRHHLDLLTADYIKQGYPRQEAHRRARIDFGGLLQIREECLDAKDEVVLARAKNSATHTMRSAMGRACAALTMPMRALYRRVVKSSK